MNDETSGWQPELGDRKTWTPSVFTDVHGNKLDGYRPGAVPTVTGSVVYVNAEHRWYRVRYETPLGGVQHECFKF